MVAIFKITDSFRRIKIGDTVWSPSRNEDNERLGHAMVITGYNKKTRQFELMNSWGRDWGNEGFVKISFDDFVDFALFGYQIIPNIWETTPINKTKDTKETKNTLSLTGAFQIVDLYQNEKSKEKEKVILNHAKKQYQTSSKAWNASDGFQISAKNLTKYSHIYMFSINPKGEVNFLYPLLQDMKTSQQSNHFIYADSIEILYPPDDGFAFEMEGTDYLGILVSWEPIDDIEDKITMLSSLEGTIYDRIKTIFKDELVEWEKVRYQTRRMQFKSNFSLPLSSNKIIPIILAIDVK